MSEQKINITEWFARQDEVKCRVTEAEKALVIAQSGLTEFQAAVKRIVLEQLDRGQSTGDALLDEAFRFFRLNKEALDRCVAFNNRLIQHKGRELLAVFPYRQQIRFSGPGDERESDYANCGGYVFGVLSGERLELKYSGDESGRLEITLPFERHITWGFEKSVVKDDGEPVKGKMTLHGATFLDLGLPTAMKLLACIIGEKDADVSIFIADQVEDPTTGGVRTAQLESMRKVLNAATPEERIMGADI